MKGTIFKRKLARGVAWGYAIDAGRDAEGKRLRTFSSGFPTKGAAAKACSDAITEYESTHGRIVRDVDQRRRVWRFELGETTETGFTTREAAEQALQRAIDKRVDAEARRAAEARADENLTLERYFALWMGEHAKRRLAPKTFERYGELGAYFVRLLGATPINELTTAEIQRAVHQLEDRGGAVTKQHPQGRPLAPKTVRSIGSLLYTALSEADRLGFLKVPHPMRNKRVRLPKVPKRKPAVLDQAKLAELFGRARGTRLFPFVVLAADTGCRRGELLAAQWTDLDFETGVLEVSKSLEQTKAGLRVKSTKSGEPRRFGLSDWALEVLREHRAEQDRDRALFGSDYEDNGLIFCQPHGAYYSPDRVGARVVELMRKAGLRGVSLHSLRHSHASISLSKGTPLAVVSEKLGHADQNITLSIYSHALPADTRAAARVWQDAMSEVIAATRREKPARMVADGCTKRPPKSEVIEFKGSKVAGTTGLEPAASCVTGRRSNQLNYVPEIIR